MVLPVYPHAAGLDGHSLKMRAALILKSPDGVRGQIDIDDLRHLLRAGRTRVFECLDRLVAAGRLRYTYLLGVIDFFLIRGKDRVVHIDKDGLRALLSLGPSDVKLYFAVCEHANTQDGIAWPSYHRLGEILGRTRRTVQRGVRALQELGLLAVTRVPWQKIPRFKWAANRRIKRKRITVFVRPRSYTRTVSRNGTESCRTVREELVKDLCCAGRERRIFVSVDNLPAELRQIADIDESGVGEHDYRRVRTLVAVGCTLLQAQWLCSRASPTTIDAAIRRLNERWSQVRHRVRYLIGTVRRLGGA
jgi:predicted transcriptional regulator